MQGSLEHKYNEDWLDSDEYKQACKEATQIIDLKMFEKTESNGNNSVHFLSDDSGIANLFEKHAHLVDGVILYLSHYQHKIHSHREYLHLREMSKNKEIPNE